MSAIDQCENVLNTILRVTRDEYHLISDQMLTLEMQQKDVLICTTFDYETHTHHVGCLGLQI